MGEYKQADLERIGRTWLEKIRQSEKREETWLDDAEIAETAFTADEEAEKGEVPRFNILHSNVETIVPSIYNSTPVPDIRPRHNNKDDVAKKVSDAFERAISTQTDDNALDTEIEASAQDAFMAGRGIVRLKFDADVEDVPEQTEMQVVALDDLIGEPIMQEVVVAPATQRVTNERIVYEVVSWRDYREGPAKRWSDVPWVCFRHEVSETERERLENPDMVKAQDTEDNVDEKKDCTVWEIWCKETGKVYFVVDESGKVLDIQDDPLNLSDFFPCAQPVQPITPTGKRCPVNPYKVYKGLADELDLASRRINAIMKGLKVRGAVAADAEAIELISSAGDNELVPVANIENLVAAGGLEKAIMWWPIDKAISVLQQLYVQREQTKQAIYEITGISDIIRGQGAASETATAQQIKTEWGSLRIKKLQNMIQRQVRELFKMSAEIISLHFSFETIGKAAGIEIDQQMAQLLQQPLDHYRIDVESDSTIRADTSRNRQQMAQFLEGTASFFNTMSPIVAQAPQTAGPIVEMYSAFARQFSLGKSAEDALEQMVQMAKQVAEQPPENPEAKAKEAEMQLKGQEFQHKAQMDQAQMQQDAAKFQAEMNLKAADLKLKEADLRLKGEHLDLDEARAEVEAASRFAEIEIEQDQQRAAKIGNT